MKAQKDIIIKRDGSELQVKIMMVDTQETSYKLDDKKNSEELKIDNADIYMIKYEKRGNVFFSETGERFLGKDQGKLAKDAVMLYMKAGEEILAYELGMNTKMVNYKISKKKKAEPISVPKEKVFMIKYPDGTRDILTQFKNQKPSRKNSPEASAPSVEQKSSLAAPAIGSSVGKAMQPAQNKAVEVVIKTHAKASIKALVVEESSGKISFFRAKSASGPLYQIDRSMIKSIEYSK